MTVKRDDKKMPHYKLAKRGHDLLKKPQICKRFELEEAPDPGYGRHVRNKDGSEHEYTFDALEVYHQFLVLIDTGIKDTSETLSEEFGSSVIYCFEVSKDLTKKPSVRKSHHRTAGIHAYCYQNCDQILKELKEKGYIVKK